MPGWSAGPTVIQRIPPALHDAGQPSQALGSVLELIADRFRTDEVIRYEAALRGNAAYLTPLGAPTR